MLINDIYKTVVFEDEESACQMVLDLLSEVYYENRYNYSYSILSLYDYMVAVDYNLDDNDITDEYDYGWTADEVFDRFHTITYYGKCILVLPKPRSLLTLYDRLEKEESYLI